MATGDKNFNYPILEGWATDDIVVVAALYSAVAEAYERGVAKDKLLAAYTAFKEVVPSKGEEKQLDKALQSEAGYSIYRVMQASKVAKQTVRMEG